MIDTKELRRLADEARYAEWNSQTFHLFQKEVSPATMIELLDRLEESKRRIGILAKRLMDPDQERARLIEVLKHCRRYGLFNLGDLGRNDIWEDLDDAVEACSDINIEGDEKAGAEP